jgi:hypothetical protein
MADLHAFIDPLDRLHIPSGRLVVLVPSGRVDTNQLGSLVWALAMRELSEEVLYLSVVSAPGEEIEVSHQLAKLASVTKDARFQVNTQILFGVSWPEAVRQAYHPGDQILCLEDQVVRRWFLWNRPVARWVSSELKLPVCLLLREIL